MNIPRSNPNWAKLVEGQIDHQFKIIAASLMVSGVIRRYRYDPTPAKLQESIDQLVEFCTKYEKLVQDDLKIIFN